MEGPQATREEALAHAAAGLGGPNVGLGVDIVEVGRMKAILKRTPSFAERVFSPDERAYCDASSIPATHYALRFAAKEAVVKALGCGFSDGVGVRDIEVRRADNGRPFVALSGRAREIADEQGVREIPVSLSFTHTDAVACALAITSGSVRAAEKRVDPRERLAQRFRETRGILDEL
ncbi:holo-ACP synthase [Eggerthellaceae bacterium zg-997]|nr:holo-ACP synthase [Eggerthellaceae bacterium zg-997]